MRYREISIWRSVGRVEKAKFIIVIMQERPVGYTTLIRLLNQEQTR